MAPASLPENTGFAFLGETAWAPVLLTDRAAEKILAATNPCGRPNSDVLRRRLAVEYDAPVETWQIDFPAHFTAQEAALYAQPFARLPATGWQNPHLNADLRRALARLSRYLAMPAASEIPEWRWIEDDLIPDATLLVVARDDDFAHGVLASRAFALWWTQHRQQPIRAIESFPFPWPPGTLLSALTKSQEEHRLAIARAARGGDPDRLNEAVPTAYGWPSDLSADETVEFLTRKTTDAPK